MNASLGAGDALLSLRHEDVAYSGKIALKNLTLTIAEGEKVALIGPSGAGKTTLLRRLYQLDPNNCAFVHQHHVLVPQLSTFHNIYMGRLDHYSSWQNLINLLKPTRSAMQEILPIVQKLGLEEKMYTRIGELSGGQKQRVGIGRALYQGGSIIMADEPVSSLDALQSLEIMQLLVEAGRTVVAALHSIDLSQRFFHRIVGLKHGSIAFDLPVRSLTEDRLSRLYG